MKQQLWDSSDQKAHELDLSAFGTLEEAYNKAEMPRKAHNFSEANKILESLINKPLTNPYGLTAVISKNSAKEILSGKAVKNSFEKEAHLLASVNVDKLFSNAIEPWNFDLDPEKSNISLKAIRRIYAPMQYNGRIVIVKLTVKEMKNTNEGNRLYSLKAINVEVEKNKGAGNLAPGVT